MNTGINATLNKVCSIEKHIPGENYLLSVRLAIMVSV